MIILDKATIVTSEKEAIGTIVVENGRISDICYSDNEDFEYRIEKIIKENADAEVWNLEGKHIIAGGIDAHVHFREPGLTHKADMQTESQAAIAGGVTTVFDMPNTSPATISPERLRDKIQLAKGRTAGKIGFHIGATNVNASQIRSLVLNGDPATGLKAEDIAGVKVFMGSSTGNMLVDEKETLNELFSISEKPVLVHCEDEDTIKANLAAAIEKYGDCLYGSGAQVGAYARFYLAKHLEHKGDKEGCEKLQAEILKLYPDALTHRGGRMADFFRKGE